MVPTTGRPAMSDGPLAVAARTALHAPSVFNTQPWRWRVAPDLLELRVAPDRGLPVTDPDGKLLTISCGAALHHARVALAAAGHRVEVARLPNPAVPRLLARLRLTGSRTPTAADTALLAAVPRRRTDRRAFADTPVPAASLDRLRAAVEAEGVHLHVVRHDQMPMLAVATAHAAATELADPAYRAELARWTHRPADERDGVPATVAVRPAPRRVPVRDHAVGGAPGLEVGAGFDRGASYVVLYGESDDRAGWLAGGEALSALLLTAVVEGLSAAPISDAVEVSWPRGLLRDLLAGTGEPYLAVRIGVAVPGELPPVPRRGPDQVIEFQEGPGQ
ncbi:Acg family FMN-binding oxidoreductase [Plantactinospora sp. GCM10030261]|uniref:Acg family FMN-binding oxidoreductase n=1 Tax=Plantactinospora sp. GCM10030261 TaxID=3273420 RepID=UPI00361266B3